MHAACNGVRAASPHQYPVPVLTQTQDDYNKFYEAFSKNLKLGVYEDSQVS